jgi:hypothetical protein
MSYSQLMIAHFRNNEPIDIASEWQAYFNGEISENPKMTEIKKMAKDLADSGLGDIILSTKQEEKRYLPGANNQYTAGRKIDQYDRQYNN